MKQTVSLDSSPIKVSSNYETFEIFTIFLGGESPVTPGTRFFTKISEVRKWLELSSIKARCGPLNKLKLS